MSDEVQAVHPYVSAHTRATWSIYLLAANIVHGVVALWSGYLQLDLLNRIKDGLTVTQAEAMANDNREAIVALVGLGLIVITAIVFLTWIYRAHKNLGALGARNLDFTSGWAVGWFFIPIMNLVRPYQIAEEIRAASNPEITDPTSWEEHKASGVIRGWWALWILSGIAARLSVEGSDLDGFIMATWAGLIASLFSIGAAALGILMIREIDNRQSAKKDRLGILEGVPPLPPQPGPQTGTPPNLN